MIVFASPMHFLYLFLDFVSSFRWAKVVFHFLLYSIDFASEHTNDFKCTIPIPSNNCLRFFLSLHVIPLQSYKLTEQKNRIYSNAF